MSIDVMNEVDCITQEQIAEQEKADKEAQLVPEGTFEGRVIFWNKVEESEKGENNQFKGVPQYKIGLKFFDCPEEGHSKTQFFNMTTHKLLNDKGRPKVAYTTALGLTKVMGMAGQPLSDVLEQAKVTRAKYRVGQFLTPDDTIVNYLKAVSAA